MMDLTPPAFPNEDPGPFGSTFCKMDIVPRGDPDRSSPISREVDTISFENMSNKEIDRDNKAF
jgi:hypothetical protein